MTLRDALSLLPAEAMVPVGWVRDQLAAESPGAGTVTPKDDGVDLTTADVGTMFNRSESTVRQWCADGLLPGSYRLNGREWRVPLSAVQAMQAAQAQSAKESSTPRPPSCTRPADLGQWRQHMPRKAS